MVVEAGEVVTVETDVGAENVGECSVVVVVAHLYSSNW